MCKLQNTTSKNTPRCLGGSALSGGLWLRDQVPHWPPCSAWSLLFLYPFTLLVISLLHSDKHFFLILKKTTLKKSPRLGIRAFPISMYCQSLVCVLPNQPLFWIALCTTFFKYTLVEHANDFFRNILSYIHLYSFGNI